MLPIHHLVDDEVHAARGGVEQHVTDLVHEVHASEERVRRARGIGSVEHDRGRGAGADAHGADPRGVERSNEHGDAEPALDEIRDVAQGAGLVLEPLSHLARERVTVLRRGERVIARSALRLEQTSDQRKRSVVDERVELGERATLFERVVERLGVAMVEVLLPLVSEEHARHGARDLPPVEERREVELEGLRDRREIARGDRLAPLDRFHGRRRDTDRRRDVVGRATHRATSGGDDCGDSIQHPRSLPRWRGDSHAEPSGSVQLASARRSLRS